MLEATRYGLAVRIPVAMAGLAATAAAAVASVAGRYLCGTVAVPRATQRQAELERAVAAIDRELAADLELMAMFDQTKQAFVLENGQFLAHREVIETLAPEALAAVADLYQRIPEAEAAMERRGPAGSIADTDLALIHAWEGDAREAQRALRAATRVPRRTRWAVLGKRLRERFANR